ncbi:hypothetical protein GGS24DRAFT_510453 [Hypoxylon argillaceum]|nr:hypothetical protein GGS24DRAFT_510453 [Hypoxylon argillaceum]
MRHPSNPTSHIVDPFSVLWDKGCAATISKPSGSLQCPVHDCCHISTRTFPCGCGNVVGYHRYLPAKVPSAYTIDAAQLPSPGVWRILQSLDDLSFATQAQPAPSEELQIARLGLQYAIDQLGSVAKGLEAASRKRDLKEQNMKNGAPYEKELQAAQKELERLSSEAWDIQTTYYTWVSTVEKLEQLESGKVSAVELSA